MSTKKLLTWSLVGGLLVGFGVIGLLFVVSDNTSQWYARVNAVQHSRAVLVDYSSPDTVTIVDFIGTAVKLTHEP